MRRDNGIASMVRGTVGGNADLPSARWKLSHKGRERGNVGWLERKHVGFSLTQWLRGHGTFPIRNLGF